VIAPVRNYLGEPLGAAEPENPLHNLKRQRDFA
jgi:hypothetical protein